MVPISETGMPDRAIATAATAAGPPPARTIWDASTRSSASG